MPGPVLSLEDEDAKGRYGKMVDLGGGEVGPLRVFDDEGAFVQVEVVSAEPVQCLS